MQPILIVGAGFAGAVHARALAEAGFAVHVIDQRCHIGGNAFDTTDENGIRVHAYGPHLFHTKMQKVADWIGRFGEFVPYVHKVRARLPSGRHVPLPINLDTVNAVFGTDYTGAEAVRAHLRAVSLHIPEPANAAEYLHAHIGRELTDLFFRPYTRKMWALELEDMSANVVKRIPLRMNRRDSYFEDDEIQMMPRHGYAQVFKNIFDHENISVSLRTQFAEPMLANYHFCFNSMPIDAFFNDRLGPLPYRSLKFHHRTEAGIPDRAWSIVNFTDHGPFTRETMWHAMPHHLQEDRGRHSITLEEPCDYRQNNFERYYPVKTADGRYTKLYDAYRSLAEQDLRLDFIGRCGTYQYLDMDQVINQSLANVSKWIREFTLRPMDKLGAKSAIV